MHYSEAITKPIMLLQFNSRYIQVGNAVAVPVARALGYALGLAAQGSVSDGPLFTLPPKFPNMERNSSLSTEEDC